MEGDAAEEISYEEAAADDAEAKAQANREAEAEERAEKPAKKTRAERQAEKDDAEAAERLRRHTPQPVKLDAGANPRWWVPTMLTLMVLGLAWLVVAALSRDAMWPVPKIGMWNYAVGFALIMIGFMMTTRWK
ncbi:cell division protein CrgA [Calidifontibacter sp. DB0510]|uniref:Cell division protein CrgA n=1 Tax=Metallococcus carri TaxID=1656884 RepID=A0A967AZV7_9MICO|nr:cell division protein CrgA [Metallococcus carri]NOP38775.1 cell division protein CrgA [Calidifontibacter sp. DB2511S]